MTELRQLVIDDALYMLCLPDGGIRYIDACFVELMHLPDRDYADDNSVHWQAAFPPTFCLAAKAAIEQVTEQHQVASFEYELLGQPCLMSVKPIINANDELLALSWHGKPLHSTERYHQAFNESFISAWMVSRAPLLKVLEKFAIQSPKDLAKHLNEKTDFFADFRLQLQVLEVNPAAKELFQLGETDNFKMELVHYLDEISLVQVADQLLATDKHNQFFHQDITIDGKKKAFWFSCRAFADVLHFNALDVSNLKDAENDLEQQEKFLAATLKALPDYLMVYDFEAREHVFQNRNLIKSLGYDENDIAAAKENMINYITHSDDQLTGEMFKQVYDDLSHGRIFETTIRLQHKNGSFRHFYFRASALAFEGAEHSLKTAVVVARDITAVLESDSYVTEEQRHHQLLADNFSDVVLTTDDQLNVNYVSPSFETILDSQANNFSDLGNVLSSIGLGDKVDNVKQQVNKVGLKKPEDMEDYTAVFESEAIGANHLCLPIEIKISVIRDEHGFFDGLLLVIRDITERRRYQDQQLLAAKVFESSLDGIYITDNSGLIVQVNQAFIEITGYQKEDVVGKKPSVLNSGWHDTNFTETILPSLTENGAWNGEIMSRRTNGEAFLVWMNISRVKNINGQSMGLITTFKDITKDRSSEENIKKLAYYDTLTELPNRMLFHDRLGQAIQRAMRGRMYVAVLFLDLDGFKAVNDSLGHACGDVLLKEVAKRLQTSVRSDDTVARMGGDEFTVVLHALKTRSGAESAAAKIASKIIDSLAEVFVINNTEVYIGTSIGISLYPDDCINQDELLENADKAMYHAKNNGKGQYQFFTNDMHERAEQRHQIELDVQGAIERQEFELAYQPKINKQNHECVGFEALLRWQHSEKGLLMPNMFMQSIYDLGIGFDVGDYVLDKACQQISQLQNKGLPQGVSVNIFPKQFRDGRFVASIEQNIKAHNIEPERLTLEISENFIMDDAGVSYSILNSVSQLGVRIAIDDFASTAISLQYLKRLPMHQVKISRNMVMQIDRMEDQAQFLTAVINLGVALGFEVVVEGVEKESQLAIIKESQCHTLQGYLFDKPLRARKFEIYLEALQEVQCL